MAYTPILDPPPRRSRLWLLAQVPLGLAPLAWVLASVDLSETAARLEGCRWSLLFLAGALVAVSIGVGAVRWRQILLAYGVVRPPSSFQLFGHSLVGMYFNLLPLAVGGEMVRAYRVRNEAGGMGQSLMIAFVDRLAGLFGLLGLVALGAFWGAKAPDPRVATLAGLTVAVAVGSSLVALLLPFVLRRRPGWGKRWIEGRSWAGSLLRLRPPEVPFRLAIAGLLSLVTQGAAVLTVLFLLSAVGESYDWQRALPIAPWVVLLIFAPVTPFGLGQRELVFVELWSLIAIDRASSLSASLLYFALALGCSGLGGMVLVWERFRDARPGQ